MPALRTVASPRADLATAFGGGALDRGQRTGGQVTRADILSTAIPGLGLHSAGGARNTGERTGLLRPETLTSVARLCQDVVGSLFCRQRGSIYARVMWKIREVGWKVGVKKGLED